MLGLTDWMFGMANRENFPQNSLKKQRQKQKREEDRYSYLPDCREKGFWRGGGYRIQFMYSVSIRVPFPDSSRHFFKKAYYFRI